MCRNSVTGKSAIYERVSDLKLDTIEKAPSCLKV